MASFSHIPIPAPLKMTSSYIAADWKRFKSQYLNYEVASELSDKLKQKRAAVFLACVGTEAYEIYQTFEFEDENDRSDIDKVLEAFQRHCVGEVNVTYERYVFNQRTQLPGETFDVFLADLRRLAKTCEYGGVEDSILRDRIVIGVHDDATRRKLLQRRKLELADAIDVCKASEVAMKQLKAMTTGDEVNTVKTSKRLSSQSRDHQVRREFSDRNRDANYNMISCKYCGKHHERSKQSCRAFGEVCRRCGLKNHFASVCNARIDGHSQRGGEKGARVHQLQDDEQLLALTKVNSNRIYARLIVDGRSVRFLLDCGATVSLLSKDIADLIDPRRLRRRPPNSTLRMFDNTVLPTNGMIEADVEHSRTHRKFRINFYIAENHEQPILGLDSCLKFDLLSVVEENICAVQPTPTVTQEFVLQEYSDLFEGLGALPGEVHLDIDPSVRPVQLPARRLPEPIKEKVRLELKQMCRDGVIEPVNEPSAWISALLVTTRADGRIRICLDPKPLNNALLRNHFRTQTIDDILPQLANAKVFSTCDAKNGFWLVKLDAESSKLTCFDSPFGRHRWLRMPFGAKSAPELFAAKMHEALHGLNGVACIADDILTYGCGETVEEAKKDHDRNFIAMLERCRLKGIRLNKQKLQICREVTRYMGCELTANGLQPDSRKFIAITQMEPPADRQGLMRMLGTSGFLARFCPAYSETTAVLRELLRKDSEYRWNDDTHGAAWRKLKELLTTAPVLQYYDVTKPVLIQADASSFGIGAVAMQDDRVIEYASRSLTRIERDSYAQIERELAAILFAMERFDSYVYGKSDVTVQTDHKPLLSIVKKSLSSAPKRLQRMLLRLQRYSFNLEFLPTSRMLVADTLSRACLPLSAGAPTSSEFTEEIAAVDEMMSDLKLVASQRTIDMITTAAATDEQYALLLQQIARGWPDSPAAVPSDIREYFTFADELTSSAGLAYRGQRVIVPRAVRQEILDRLHSSHFGINSTIRRARGCVFYPGLTKDIKQMISQCSVCQAYQNENQQETLMSHPAPNRPWQKVGLDIFTFRNHDYLITVDYLSAYFEIDRLPSKRIVDIVYCLKQQFARHGIPDEVFSDNSPFNAVEFKKFAECYEFQHTTSSPRYPQSNGRAESAVKIAKAIMTKAVESSNDPFLALLEWRNTPTEKGRAPAEIIYGRRTRTRLPCADKLLTAPYDTEARAALNESKLKQARYYNVGAKDRPTLSVGQPVRVKLDENTEWRPALVSRVRPYRSYDVQLEDGTTRRRTSRHIRVSNEPPIVIDDDDLIVPSSTPSSVQPPIAGTTSSATMTADGNNNKQTLRTRSGRQVVKPARYR
jgi:hypothetical protein